MYRDTRVEYRTALTYVRTPSTCSNSSSNTVCPSFKPRLLDIFLMFLRKANVTTIVSRSRIGTLCGCHYATGPFLFFPPLLACGTYIQRNALSSPSSSPTLHFIFLLLPGTFLVTVFSTSPPLPFHQGGLSRRGKSS